MARFTDLRDDVENIAQVTDQRNLVNRIMNRTLSRIAGFHPWPFYLDEGFFTTVDDITAGDADVTNGSASVTSDHASTSWPAGVVGRKFRLTNQNAYYRILTRVSATSITLETTFQGDTDTDEGYVIYQDEYRLRADVHVYHLLRQIQQGYALIDLDPAEFDILLPTPTAQGDPNYAINIGTRRDTYATGTVTATGSTITGTSTAWTGVQGLSRGSRIRIGTAVYTVQSVDSDTSITVYETVTTVSGATAYVIYLNNPRILIHQIPDAARNIYYRYWRNPVPLVNDYDEPDLPPDWQWLLVVGSLSELFTHKGDADRSTSNEQQFLTGLQRMKSQYRVHNKVFQRYPQGSVRRRYLQPGIWSGTSIEAHAP